MDDKNIKLLNKKNTLAALELCCFTEAKISLILASGVSLSFIPEDVGDNEIKGKLSSQSDSRNTISQSRSVVNGVHIKCVMSYKKQALAFDSRVVNFEGNTLVIKTPEESSLTDLRSYPRKSMSYHGASNLSGQLDRTKNSISIKNYQICGFMDYSAQSMGLFLNRKDGLLLPDEESLVLTIKNFGEPILVSIAKIIRLDMGRRQSGVDSSYYVVLALLTDSQINAKADFEKTNDRPISERRNLGTRIVLPIESNSFLIVSHPFFPETKIKGFLTDLSISGLSFVVEESSEPLLNGMYLIDVEIFLPAQTSHKIRLEIVRVSCDFANGQFTMRVGTKLIGSSGLFLKTVSAMTQKDTYAHIYDANVQDYEALWDLFFESKFIYSGKRRQIQKYFKNILQTFFKLMAKDNDLVKKIVYKVGNEVVGYISAFRSFDHAWSIQHLNSKSKLGTLEVAKSLIAGIVDFFANSVANELNETKYFFFFYRPDNLFPAIVFGQAKEIIADPLICDLQTFDFCLMETSSILDLNYDRFVVRECDINDCFKLELALVESGLSYLIKIENLFAESMTTMKISESYKNLGLYRYRKVYKFIEHGSDCLVYAICCYSSAGLNLSELSNSIRMIKVTSKAESQDLWNYAARYSFDSYASTEMKDPVLLLSEAQDLPQGFRRIKQYNYWFIDVKYVKLFQDSLEVVFTSLRGILKEKRATKESEEQNEK